MANSSRIMARGFAGKDDLLRVYDLADCALDDALNVVDLPWRMTSPSARALDRVRLWENSGGELIAWAVLQFPAWHCLDYSMLPEARTRELESEILAWACERLESEATARSDSLPFYVSAREQDIARIVAIEHSGFVRQNWGYVHMIRDLNQPIPDATPPAGFTVRSLAGVSEVDTYVAVHRAAFDSESMTAEWRRATLCDPRYVPELDLVAVGTDGAVVGFCVSWIAPLLVGQRVAQIEPLGVLPEYQGHGIGRVLLLEGLRRARSLGADRMDVNAETFNAASHGAYQSVGFRPAYETPFFLRSFDGRPATRGGSQASGQ